MLKKKSKSKKQNWKKKQKQKKKNNYCYSEKPTRFRVLINVYILYIVIKTKLDWNFTLKYLLFTFTRSNISFKLYIRSHWNVTKRY
jgi:hypothetical protein